MLRHRLFTQQYFVYFKIYPSRRVVSASLQAALSPLSYLPSPTAIAILNTIMPDWLKVYLKWCVYKMFRGLLYIIAILTCHELPHVYDERRRRYERRERERNARIYAWRYCRQPPPEQPLIELSDERRPLTRPSSPTRGEATIAGRACWLLDALPLEVREMIWVEVLGGHYIHLQLEGNAFRGGICESSTPDRCSQTVQSRQWDEEPHDQIIGEMSSLLPLLMSCKQM